MTEGVRANAGANTQRQTKLYTHIKASFLHICKKKNCDLIMSVYTSVIPVIF